MRQRARSGHDEFDDEQANLERALISSRIRFGMLLRIPQRRRDIAPDLILRGRRPLYGFAVLLALLSVVTQQPLLFVAALLLLALAVLPEIWYRFGLLGVRISQRPSSERVAFGGVVDVPLVIENRKPLPLPWLEVNDAFPDGLPTLGLTLALSPLPERATLVNTLSLWAYQRVRRHYRLRGVARGAYTFGPALLRVSDPCGVLTREGASSNVSALLVHPLIAPLDRFGLSPRAPFGERKASQRLHEDPLRIVGVRDYTPGDDPRRIHWQATARMGTLQSKMYEPSARHTLMIFLDARTFANPNIGYDPPLIEMAISAAASVASWGVAQGYAVGLISNGTLATRDLANRAATPAAPVGALHDDDLARQIARAAAHLRLRLPPAAPPEQATRILDGLARLLPYTGASMRQMLVSEQRRLPTGATVVYIGAESLVDVPTLIALRQFRARGYAVSLLLTTAEGAATEPSASAPDAPSEPANAHELHLANLPIIYIGGRARWRALVASALGADAQRRASSPLSDRQRATERQLARSFAADPHWAPPALRPTPDASLSGLAPGAAQRQTVAERAPA